MRGILFAVLCLALTGSSFAAKPVIYGTDNRHDLFEVTNPLYLKLADSTVALMKSDTFQQNSSGLLSIKSDTFKNSMGVCSTERFADQYNAAFCSGSLIGKNVILTAGHCITDSSECATTKFVFGYNVKAEGQYPTTTPESEVYTCKKIIHREQNGDGADFGVILLDRNVTGHEPLKLAQVRMNSTIENGTKLVMIGHPSGLPTKIDDEKSVRDGNQSGFFVANTDSYGGNSGSAVFNELTGEIEGVLVRGENDFVQDPSGSCNISNVCPADGCRGEDVTKISSVIPYLPHT